MSFSEKNSSSKWMLEYYFYKLSLCWYKWYKLFCQITDFAVDYHASDWFEGFGSALVIIIILVIILLLLLYLYSARPIVLQWVGIGKREMLNDTNTFFSLINLIDCQSSAWKGEKGLGGRVEVCAKGKFAQTSLVFPHLKINQKRLGSLILSFVYLMGCCRIYGCN